LLVLTLLMTIWWREDFFPVVRYVEAVFVLLLIMAGYSAGVVADRLLKYRAARTQSRTFQREVAATLRARDFDEAIAIAKRFRRSPAAQLVESGLTAFQEANLSLSDGEAVESATRAMKRSSGLVRQEFRRGLNVVASTTTTAPLTGAFGTVFGIINSFRGCDGARSACMAAQFGLLSQGLLPLAAGLVLGVVTQWCGKHLRTELDTFDIEMESQAADVVNCLFG
jgi:biopolymer transport protein ExbB/TolQ